jgi:hypothetical protein
MNHETSKQRTFNNYLGGRNALAVVDSTLG